MNKAKLFHLSLYTNAPLFSIDYIQIDLHLKRAGFGHLVLPVGIAVGVVNRLEDRSHGARGVGVPLLVQDVAAPVVYPYP